MTDKNLRVLSLNCWGLPWSKNVNERIDDIAKALSKGNYHIIILNEIFRPRDIKLIIKECSLSNPYSHYFSIGFVGTGILILSKYRFLDMNVIPYPNIGKIYALGGDWFASKSICFVKIDCPEKPIKLFATHTHANYHNAHNDEIRALQMYFLGKTISQLCSKDDPIILGGDLNMESFEAGIRFLKEHINLIDSCQEVHGKNADVMYTCCSPDNTYTAEVDYPCRIDYIFHNKCFCAEMFQVTFKHIPGKKITYSDHYGVETLLRFRKELPNTDIITIPSLQESDVDKIELPSLKNGKSVVDLSQLFNNGIKISSFPYQLFAIFLIPIFLIFVSFLCPILLQYKWIVCLFGFISGSVLFSNIFAILIAFVTSRSQRRVFRNFYKEINYLYSIQ